ncbi:titin homolog [Haliotis rufescens]|uniref:titin homolog n=1 Tax=Haliotis rufescens TaxID=6454 RepID=UPI00201EC7A8|nr:titin homolog [Haliotis rufescens]XP_046367548.2 titin homolog [Haliotis rufescens]
MATRRSRLQVKPNIGPKPSRGGIAGRKSSSGDAKPTKDAKKPEPTQCSDQKEPEPTACSDQKEPEPTACTSDPKKYEPTEDAEKCDTIKSELTTVKQSTQEKVDCLFPKLIDVPVERVKEDINDTSNIQEPSTSKSAILIEKSLTGIKNKGPDNVVEIKDTTSEKHDKKPETRPKFRSRFPKAKPNLANIGRPENRKTSHVPPAASAKPQPEVDASGEPEEEPVSEQATIEKTTEEAPLNVTTDVECSGQDKLRGGDHADHPQASESEADLEKSPRKFEPKPPERGEKSIFEKPVVPILKQEKKPVVKHLCPKKRKQLPPINAPPDRATMKMIDLIYWNPSSNPMTKKLVPGKPKEVCVTDLTAATEEENRVDTPGDDGGEDSLPVPQVKIGPDGQIILNEASLVVDNKTSDEPMETDIIEEDESTVNYESFREKRPKTSWSELETVKFYKALSTVGTDFSLMMHLFPSRTRREIKNKFKKEEKLHRREIDKAIQNRTAFNMTDFERLQEEAEEEHRLKQQKDLIKKEKGQRGKKRKTDADDIKENKAVKTRRRKKKKTVFHEDEDDDLDDAESFRAEGDSGKKPASSRVKEVVEILMDMSRGKLSAGTKGQGEGQNDLSDAESEAPSEAPSEAVSVTSDVFVPRSVRSTLRKKITTCNIEEDRTIDNQILATDIATSGDIGHLVNNVMSKSVVPEAVKSEATNSDIPSAIPSVSSANSGSVSHCPPTPKVPAVSVNSDNVGGVQHMEIPEGLLPIINTAGGADKVQIVLVHDVDADSGQTVVHVYILPKTAEEFSIGGNTVQLTPTKTNPNSSDRTAQCSQSNRTSQGNVFKHEPLCSEPSASTSSTAMTVTSSTPSQPIASTSRAVTSSPLTPFRRLSSNTVTLAQTAAVSAVKPSSPTSPLPSSTLHTAAMSPGGSDKLDIEGMNPLTSPSPSPSPSPRVCLFKDEVAETSTDVGLAVKKE